MLSAFVQKSCGKEMKKVMISRGVYQKLMIPLSDDKSVVLFKWGRVAAVSIEQCGAGVDQVVWSVQFTPKEWVSMGGKKLKAGIMAELAEIGGERLPIVGDKGMMPMYRYIDISATTDMNDGRWCLAKTCN